MARAKQDSVVMVHSAKAKKPKRQKKQAGLAFKKLKKGVYWQWWRRGLCVCQSTIAYKTEGGAAKGFGGVLRDIDKAEIV